jgi:hypothetical protein
MKRRKTMDVTLMNPTDEHMEPLIGGKPLVLAPGAKKRVDGSVGNHIINTHGPRGIISLDYDDNIMKSPHDKTLTVEEWKIKKGRETNKEFKTKQILNYNQLNEKRKMEGLSFLPPTDQVKGYAEELGLELLSPYTITDKDQSKINTLKEENLELREQNLKLQEQNIAILGKLDQLIDGKTVTKDEVKEVVTPPEVNEDEAAKLHMKNQFYKLGKYNFKSYVKQNLDTIKAWPEDVKTMVREKHAKMGLGELVI